ncbi:VIT domain-containing protein [Olleya sp. YS]|uniref:VIT domain-containing protein n=1 Tax=Olleya sp. YS TaxID=3028318 RepID=UPI0024344EED|nr:VIT domain-containing protein [Olleya sp. YS]WGD34380.1 VIT domain-containing protein [Olleya sp. YS]
MKLFRLFFFLISINLIAQEVPRIKLQDSTFLALKELDVKTEVVGNIATTTYTMKFFNGTDRVLEGELAFPLGQGQSVTNFAMDVNGKMRDAVIVEKELGRVAYESTIRQTIDPGLLEITKGNNYKARVYPIPANDYKLLSITFEQEMNASDGKHVYEIPFNFSDPLDFNLDILVYNTNQQPEIKNKNPYKLKFKNSDGVLKASVNKKNTKVDTSVVLEFLVGNSESVTTYNNYFNVYKLFTPKTRIKEKPSDITIYWDASYSMKFRNLDAELKLLELYFEYLDNVNVNFVTFSNKMSKSKQFNIKNGHWKALKKDIESIVYDGGTSYLELKNDTNNEILFFSDGMFNLGQLQDTFRGRLYAINSVKSANHQFLEYTSNQNNGKYINLNFTNHDQALHALKTEAFKFLGIKDNDLISEVFPLPNTTITSDFSVSGQFEKNTDIQLNFGYGNQVTESIKITLEQSSFNSLVKRLWAKKKLQVLNNDKEVNKDEIIKLAKKNHLISEFTSLIILDRIEDYVRYKIEPPAELKAEYKQRLANRAYEDEERFENIQDRKNQLVEDYQELIKWYNTVYPIVTVISEPKKINDTTVTVTETKTWVVDTLPEITPTVAPNLPTVAPSPPIVNTPKSQTNLDTNKRIVSGVISDENGLPLPGAYVLIKGTSNGTSTDFDGNFSINAEVGDVIEVGYIGYGTKIITIGGSNNINFSLEPDNSLDEVVIVGYGTTTTKAFTGVASTVIAENIEVKSFTNVTQALAGEVAGVSVINTSGQPGSVNTVRVRGYGSPIGNTSPLYIVDGVPVNESEFKTIATDDINNMTILKDASATSLFGSRAANGVIVITTKEGLNTNAEQIQELDKKIREDINFKPWSPDSDYIKILLAQSTIKDAYNKYLELRIKYRNTPSFFIDVAEFFDSKKDKSLAIKVLSNLAEIDLDNHEVMRALAYKLEYFKQYDLALHVYKEVLKLRPEEPQSTRDLALAYENLGDYQKAFDLLYSIVEGQLVEKDLDKRFYGIEHLAFVEAGHLLNKYSKSLNLTDAQRQLIKPIEVDLRVVADWNHNDTDLDLWVDTPEEYAISYKNKRSDYGDRLSEDMTEGYGPEEFMIKKGLKGDYNIEVDYFADEVQKISGPTTLKITIFKNYGSKNETKEVRIYRLDIEKDLLEIGSINFK